MNTQELLDVLKAYAYPGMRYTGIAGAALVPKLVLEGAVAAVAELNALDSTARANPVPLAKSLGDLQRLYSAAVGDFNTLQTALQNRIGELVRSNMQLSRELVAMQGKELAAWRPPEPKFGKDQIVAWVGGHQTYRITGVELVWRDRPTWREWRYTFSTGGYGFESQLRALTEQEKG